MNKSVATKFLSLKPHGILLLLQNTVWGEFCTIWDLLPLDFCNPLQRCVAWQRSQPCYDCNSAPRLIAAEPSETDRPTDRQAAAERQRRTSPASNCCCCVSAEATPIEFSPSPRPPSPASDASSRYLPSSYLTFMPRRPHRRITVRGAVRSGQEQWLADGVIEGGNDTVYRLCSNMVDVKWALKRGQKGLERNAFSQ